MNLYQKTTKRRLIHPSGMVEEIVEEVTIPLGPVVALGAIVVTAGVIATLPLTSTGVAIGGAVATGAQAALAALPGTFG